MEASWLLLVLSAAVFISVVLLTVVCLDCWNRGALGPWWIVGHRDQRVSVQMFVSIRQTTSSEEYMQSTDFRVISPLQPAGDLNSIRSAPHLLSPQRIVSPSSDPGTQRRHRSFTPTETESNPSYENPADGPEYVNPVPNLPDSDVEDTGYITVIPDGEGLTPSGQSRASTPSSDVRHDYVNLEEEQDYLNVNPLLPQKSTSDLSQSDTEDDDDDEGNYVNQPQMIHSPV